MKKIIIYTTPKCRYCQDVKDFLNESGVYYFAIDVSTNKEEKSKMIELSGQMGVPVIVIDDKEIVIGFNKNKLKELLDIK